jgi:hypothetical protein
MSLTHVKIHKANSHFFVETKKKKKPEKTKTRKDNPIFVSSGSYQY